MAGSDFQLDRAVLWQQYAAQFGSISQSATDGLNFILDQIGQDTTNWQN